MTKKPWKNEQKTTTTTTTKNPKQQINNNPKQTKNTTKPHNQPTKPRNNQTTKPQSPKKEHKVFISLSAVLWVWVGAVVLTHKMFSQQNSCLLKLDVCLLSYYLKVMDCIFAWNLHSNVSFSLLSDGMLKVKQFF